MEIENLKRWQWALFGAVIGFGLAYAWTSIEPDESMRTTSQSNFEHYLTEPPRGIKEKINRVSKIVILPPQVDPLTVERDSKTGKEIAGSGKMVSLVEFTFLADDMRHNAYKAEVYRFWAPIPYKPFINAPPDDPKNPLTVQKYLDFVKQTYPYITYHDAWYRTSKWMYTLLVGGGVVLVGGIWPTLLNLMVGAGFGRPPKEKKDEYDLNRFKGGEEDDLMPAKKVVTAEDHQKVQAFADNLEKSLAASARPGGKPVVAPVQKEDEEIKPLITQPVEPSPVTAEKPKEKKDFKGEYYPVSRGAGKK